MRLGYTENSKRCTTATNSSKRILNVKFTTVSEYQNSNEHTSKSTFVAALTIVIGLTLLAHAHGKDRLQVYYTITGTINIVTPCIKYAIPANQILFPIHTKLYK